MKRLRHIPWKRVLVIAGACVLLVLVLLGLLTHWFVAKHSRDTESWGVSFAPRYARELGLEPKEVFTAALQDLGIKRFRLMSYWDQMEPSRGSYDFSELDWQMDQAAAAGAQVSLAIGLRQPRYPECHQPGWAAQLSGDEFSKALEGYIQKVVERYRDHKALSTYQLENEAMNRSFGTCKDFSRPRLISEFKLVKSLDSKHPVIVSVSNQFGLPFGQPRGDIIGFSVYRTVYQPLVGIYTPHFAIAPWHKARAALAEYFLHREVVIHELQAEPWGPEATQKLSLQEQDKSMNAERLKGVVEFARSTGIHQADLWGLEWWYWRKVKAGDPSVWEAAKQVFDY